MPQRIPTYRPPGAPDPKQAQRDYNRLGRDRALAKLYGSSRWQKFRDAIKRRRPLCEPCAAKGLTVVGEIVHHLVDPREDMTMAFSPGNVQVVCRACHNAIHKTRPR